MEPLCSTESLPTPGSSLPAPAREAGANYAANLNALRRTQPDLAEWLRDQVVAVAEWVYGRDGSLTALTGPDRWWTGCSLPRRSAEAMLKSLEINGVVGCFLAPEHAAHLRTALDKLRPQQAIICIDPEPARLAMLLRCADLSADIEANRLWFTTGEEWAGGLGKILEANPGLPVPSNFIRLPVTPPETIDRLVSEAQKVFSAETARRADAIRTFANQWQCPTCAARRVLVIAPSHFRLWDDAGCCLAEALERPTGSAGDLTWRRLDVDDPAFASPLGLSRAASNCDAVVAANVFRTDAIGILPARMPWITWVTTPRIPQADTSGPADRLLLCDPAFKPLARSAEWCDDRISLARWPDWESTLPPSTPALDDDAEDAGIRLRSAGTAAAAAPESTPCVTLIDDTRPLHPPDNLDEFSSHRLLWELIEQELKRDPFVLGDDPNAFLTIRMQKMAVEEQGLDRGAFLERLILPGYQQGIARILLRHRIPLHLLGRGWDRIDEFKPTAQGPVKTRGHLQQAINAAHVIVHPWPSVHAHPLDTCGRRVIRVCGMHEAEFLSTLRLALRGDAAVYKRQDLKPVSAEILLRALPSGTD